MFRTNMIKGAVVRSLPNNKINLHLGLSPWYEVLQLYFGFYF